jgi:hypothetical protein
VRNAGVLGDLFALADAVAGIVDAPVTICKLPPLEAEIAFYRSSWQTWHRFQERF